MGGIFFFIFSQIPRKLVPVGLVNGESALFHVMVPSRRQATA